MSDGAYLAGVNAVSDLDGTDFDAVIIGGGINGAGVARDAALRGLRVCLFEKGDFASGTSSKSTKIAHGGLRYLRNLEFGLVREAQREKRWLREALPHLVQPLSFCYPVYRGGPDPFWKIRLGVSVYDLLDGRRNPHQTLTADQALNDNPALRRDNLQGALRYWDDRMDDSRVCLETILSAEEAGAVCYNYVEAVGVERGRTGFSVSFQEAREGGSNGSVHCKAIVNCAGPWADAVLQTVGATRGPTLRPTKGVHIVVPRVAGADALVLDNPRDNRTFFAIPWEAETLIGTTDTGFEGDPDLVQVEPVDIEYLLEAAHYYLPGAALSEADITYSFAGLRPLVAPPKDVTSEGKISRSHQVIRGPSGVVTVIGGKFTTFRQMAEEAVDALLSELSLPRGASASRQTPYFNTIEPRADKRTEPDLWAWLQGHYGPRAGLVYDICLSSKELRTPIQGSGSARLGELVYAIKFEKVKSPSDLLERRTHLAWHQQPEPSPSLLEALRMYAPGAMTQALSHFVRDR